MAEAAEAPPAATRPQKQSALSIDVVKQYPGQLQVDRRVVVQIPGKFFPSLTGAEQAALYPGEPVEYQERHTSAVSDPPGGKV